MLCLFVFTSYTAAEEVKFDFVASLDVQISGIVQDEDGFLWIATNNGLMRYDGREFKVWRKGENALSEDFIRAIADTDNALWLLTNTQGLNRFDKTSGSFKHYQYDAEDANSLRGSGGFGLTVDSAGNIWVGTDNGVLSRLNPRTDSFTHYVSDPGNPNSLPPGLITSIQQDADGIFWIGSDGGGLTRFEYETGVFTNFQNDPDIPHTISDNKVSAILDDGDTLWIGTGTGGLNEFNKITREFRSYRHDPDVPTSISQNSITSIYADSERFLWIGTIHGGLNRFDKRTGTFERFLNDPEAPDAKKTQVVEEILIDRSDNLWVLSRGGSILKADRKSKGFALYRHSPSDPASIGGDTIFPVYEDSYGDIWIGTGNGGLNRYVRNSDSFVSYQHDPDDLFSLPAPGVFSIAEDGGGTLWIAASDANQGVLSAFERGSGRFIKHYRYDKNDPDGIVAHRFFLDMEASRHDPHTIWMIVSFGGLQKFDTKNGEFTYFPGDPHDSTKLAGNYITMYQDDDGILWLGGSYGLDLFDPNTEEVTRFRHDPDQKNSLIEDSVTSIFEDRYGVFWLGTTSGLDRFDRNTETFTHFNTGNGLPDDHIMGVLADDDGNIWMSSGRGLIKLNPEENTHKLYTESDGLQSDVFYYFSSRRTSSGEMWFGGFNGVNRFYPQKIKDNPHVPFVVLTSLKQGGDEIELGIVPNKLDAIELGWRSNYFEFEVAALEFTKPENNQYKYRLDGVDSEWYFAGTRNFGRYSNLPGGMYHLRVSGSNNDGVWSEDEYSLRIHVSFPPWKRWWAFCIYIAFIVFVIFAYVRFQRTRLDREKRTADGLRELNAVKDEILANTSHELRTPLFSIIGLSESLIDGVAGPLPGNVTHNLQFIVSSGRRMVNLVNDILDFSKLGKKARALDLRPIDIKTLVDVVVEVSRPLATGKDLRVVNAIPADTPSVLADENMVQQVLFNLIGNGVKFTKEGTVSVTGEVDRGFVCISVVDTGIGIPSEKFGSLFVPFEQVDGSTERAFGGTGLGLAISKKLVELHGGTIGAESKTGEGSRFWFTLPVTDRSPEALHNVDSTATSLITRFAPVGAENEIPYSRESLPESLDDPDGAYRILVVDDDPANRHTLVNLLSVEKYYISQAADGDTALSMIEKGEESGKQFHLVLLDVMMPKMSGYEVCRRLRVRYSHDELPVVMLTAKNQVSDMVAGLQSGANDYLPKPFTKSELLARIRTQFTIKDLAEKRIYAENALQASNSELRQTSQYLEAVIDNANVWLNVLDSAGNVVIWNKAAEEISGYSRDEVVGHGEVWAWSYPDERYRNEIEAKAMAIIEKGELIENFETNIRCKQGETKTISWHSRNLVDDDGVPIGSIALGRDVTDTKRLESRLMQAQKMEAVGTLASGIAHDFNNLLQAINGYAQILLSSRSEDDPDYASIKAIDDAGDRAAQLVQQLLLFGRKVSTKRAQLNVERELEQVKEILERTIPKMISIEAHLGSRLWSIVADPVQFEQILLNLGSNAADAMPGGGKLVIIAENIEVTDESNRRTADLAAGRYVIISVSDTGDGMDENTMTRIFEPFFTTKDVGKGTGLGLASVFGIVKSHGGHIECESEAGVGSIFRVYLPAEDIVEGDESRALEREVLRKGNEQVLIVDDEEPIRKFASQVLERYNYTVLTAENGEKALEIYSRHHERIDLVVLDIGMPGMGGRKCIQEIRSINPLARIIVASGYLDISQPEDEEIEEAVSYLSKPYKIQDLVSKVREVLDHDERTHH